MLEEDSVRWRTESGRDGTRGEVQARWRDNMKIQILRVALAMGQRRERHSDPTNRQVFQR